MLNTLRAYLFIIACVVLTACREETQLPSGPTEVQKTILMYLPFTESPSLYDDFQKNIKDIISSIEERKGLGENRFLVFISQSASLARLMELEFEGETVAIDTLETYRNHPLTTVEGIAAVVSRVKEVAPARSYGMIIGCHGEGWIPAKTRSGLMRSRYFGSGAAELQTNITTLAEAIERTGTHLQFLLFDVCYMSCVETTYDLRRTADRIIASTSEVMNIGMPYKLALPYLLMPEPDFEKLVADYIGFYSTYSSPYATIAVTQTQFLDPMAELMGQINAQYEIEPAQLSRVQDLDAGRYTPNLYYDFGDYVSKMLAPAAETDDNAAALLAQFNQLLAQLVPYKGTTGKIISASPFRIIDVNEFSGLTISDPSTHSIAAETKQTTNWWQATH